MPPVLAASELEAPASVIRPPDNRWAPDEHSPDAYLARTARPRTGTPPLSRPALHLTTEAPPMHPRPPLGPLSAAGWFATRAELLPGRQV